MEKKKTGNKCDGCPWRAYVSETKVLCPFQNCVRKKYHKLMGDGGENGHEKKKPD